MPHPNRKKIAQPQDMDHVVSRHGQVDVMVVSCFSNFCKSQVLLVYDDDTGIFFGQLICAPSIKKIVHRALACSNEKL